MAPHATGKRDQQFSGWAKSPSMSGAELSAIGPDNQQASRWIRRPVRRKTNAARVAQRGAAHDTSALDALDTFNLCCGSRSDVRGGRRGAFNTRQG